MHYHRRTFFFWLGVVIFPVFWAWFTLGRKFPKWQRYAAFGWMTVVLAAFAITWPQMSGQYYLMSLGLPAIAFMLAVSLWCWLGFRVVGLQVPSFLDVIILCWLATWLASPLIGPLDDMVQMLCLQDFTIYHALMVMAPVLLHLAVEPTRDSLVRFEQAIINRIRAK